MAKGKAAPEARRRQELACRLWLAYYNQALYERGAISRQDRDRMALKIGRWQGPPAGAGQGV